MKVVENSDTVAKALAKLANELHETQGLLLLGIIVVENYQTGKETVELNLESMQVAFSSKLPREAHIALTKALREIEIPPMIQ